MVGDRLFDDATVTDPFPYFAELREREPVHEVEGSGVFLVTRMELIKQIVADTETFSNHYVGFIHRGDDGNPYVLPIGRTTPPICNTCWRQPILRITRGTGASCRRGSRPLRSRRSSPPCGRSRTRS